MENDNTQIPLASGMDLSAMASQTRGILIEGLLREGELMMVVGHGKAGKTHFAQQLAMALAGERESFLGRTVCQMANVLYINNTDRADLVVTRLDAIAQGLGETFGSMGDQLTVSSQALNPKTVDELAELVPFIQRELIGLVVIDSLSRALVVAENATQAQKVAALKEAYAKLARYASATGAAFVVVHDAKEKGLEEVERLVDTRVRLLRHVEREDVTVIDVSSRAHAPMDPIVVNRTFPQWELNEEGLDPRLTDGVNATQMRALKQEAATGTTVGLDAVTTTLRAAGGKLLKSHLQQEIQATTGCSWGVASGVISEAIAKGVIVIAQARTKSNHAAVVCCLPAASADNVVDVVNDTGKVA